MVLVRKDDRGDLRVHPELVQDARGVVSNGDRGDEELRGDRARAHSLGHAPQDLPFPARQLDALAKSGRHREKRLLDPGLLGQLLLEAGLRSSLPQDVDDRRVRRMVGRNREHGDREVAVFLSHADVEGEPIDRRLGRLPSLERDGQF